MNFDIRYSTFDILRFKQAVPYPTAKPPRLCLRYLLSWRPSGTLFDLCCPKLSGIRRLDGAFLALLARNPTTVLIFNFGHLFGIKLK